MLGANTHTAHIAGARALLLDYTYKAFEVNALALPGTRVIPRPLIKSEGKPNRGIQGVRTAIIGVEYCCSSD